MKIMISYLGLLGGLLGGERWLWILTLGLDLTGLEILGVAGFIWDGLISSS